MPTIRAPRLRLPAATAGFSLVELAVVLGVLGVLAVTMTSAFGSIGQARDRNAAQAHAESARQALRTFAVRNRRLPCPDTSTHGDSAREAAGGNCSGSARVGWLPYESLGLDTPVRASRLRYGVHRGGAGMDLVVPVHGAVDHPDPEGIGGFLDTLARAAAAPATVDQPYYVDGAVGAAVCATGVPGAVLANPAFVLVAPVNDRDGDNGRHPGFDGAAHRAFAEGSASCVAPPGHPADAMFDDIVVAESATALLGWLMSIHR